ncbi:MAG TPA: hypothetical protein VFQ92_01880 [Blastocatellia bacterium]|nr:hypothetical protein [Blastocatellia bacterium]
MSRSKEGTSGPTHHPGARKGEEILEDEGKEPGRQDKGETGKGRPAGGSTARDSTKINPEDRNPIDPESPNMPPA